ncbi:MAG: hypothetical protein HY698_14795 [Deltaproteobacteria bacterium]|nr:hypothetical protein [Deltaproteobacteria bacterium]
MASNVLFPELMMQRTPGGARPELDLPQFSLASRAAYRRVMAVLKGRKRPFLVGGAIGISAQIGIVVDGDLELLVRPSDARDVLDAFSAAGFRVIPDPSLPRARVEYGPVAVTVSWGLPDPLGGVIDEAWFEYSKRVHLLDLRVRVAPIEELLWLRIAAASDDRVGDPVVEEVLLSHGHELDWQRLLLRLAGLEALACSYLFLLFYRHGARGFRAIPPSVLETLIDRSTESLSLPPSGQGTHAPLG